MNSITFSKILDPVCSCGYYVGKYQHEIDFALIRLGKEKTDDTDVSKILDGLKIKRMCCRKTFIVSPVLRLLKAGPQFNIYLDNSSMSEKMEHLRINNLNPKI